MKNFLVPIALTSAISSHIALSQEVAESSKDKLEEVFVTSSRTEMPLRQVGTSVSIIKQEEIELRGYTSLVDVLRTQEGISATNSGGTGQVTTLRIRGEAGFRTLVMIDGVQVSDPTGTQVMPQMAHISNTSDIERIEILRGPQGFVYGADAGGVVNILTRQETDGLSGQFSTEYGRYDTLNESGYIAGGNEAGDFFVSGTRQKTNGFNATSLDVDNEHDGNVNNTLHTKFGVNVSDDLRLQVVVRDVHAETEYDNCGFLEPNHNCDSQFDQTTGRVSLEHQSETVNHQFAISQTDVTRLFLTDGVTSWETEGWLRNVEYLNNIRIQNGWVLNFGTDFKTETVNSGEEETRSQLGLFSESQWQATPSTYFSFGVRYDDNDDFGENVSSRVTAAHILESAVGDIKFRSSYGTGFRAPSLSEIAYNDGIRESQVSPDGEGLAIAVLGQEKSRGGDIGVDLTLDYGATFSLTGFTQTIRDAITFDLATYVYNQDEGISRSKGVEFAFDIPITAQLSVLGNYTYNDTETSDGDQRSRVPRNLANIGASLNLLENKLKVLANFRVVHGVVDGVVDLNDYEVLDISANYEVVSNVEIFARLENADDKKYQQVNTFNTSRQAAYIGARVSF